MKQVEALRHLLSDRDLAILADVEAFRLLTTRQIRRLHFTSGHQTVAAATRACTRVLQRLRGHGLITSLDRRIGGVRQGSASLTWQLAASGERLLRHLYGRPHRRRFREPSPQFIEHGLAVSDLGVLLREADDSKRIELVQLAIEGDAYRSFVGAHGSKETLKPDLLAVTATDDFECHWMVEADRGTEHSTHLLRKFGAYLRYMRSGRYQAEHGLFPSVLWVVPDLARAGELERLIETTNAPSGLFETCTYGGFREFVVSQTDGIESLALPGILESTLKPLRPADGESFE